MCIEAIQSFEPDNLEPRANEIEDGTSFITTEARLQDQMYHWLCHILHGSVMKSSYSQDGELAVDFLMPEKDWRIKFQQGSDDKVLEHSGPFHKGNYER